MTAAARLLRIACLDCGAFVASLAHGIALAQAAETGPPWAVELALAGDPAAAASAAYVELLAARDGVPLSAAPASPPEALRGARLVIAACEGADAARRLDLVQRRAGWMPPPEGPGAVASAVAFAPGVLALAREAARTAPEAPLLLLGSGADVLAGAVRRRFGVGGFRAMGFSPRVDELRAVLGHLLGAPEEDILLLHGGVDQVGWVVRFAVGGRDGYGELGDRLAALGGRPDLRPAERLIPAVYGLTGMLRAGAGSVWPFAPGDGAAGPPGPRSFPRGVPARQAALSAAVARGTALDAAGGHPDDSPLVAAPAGRALGRMARALATGELAIVALQMPYAGDVLGWSPEVTVEVPAAVAGARVEPVAVGPLPPGVDGIPRLLGQQRSLASDYLARPDEAALCRALAATPEWGRMDQIRGMAAALHAEFGTDLLAAVGP